MQRRWSVTSAVFRILIVKRKLIQLSQYGSCEYLAANYLTMLFAQHAALCSDWIAELSGQGKDERATMKERTLAMYEII